MGVRSIGVLCSRKLCTRRDGRKEDLGNVLVDGWIGVSSQSTICGDSVLAAVCGSLLAVDARREMVEVLDDYNGNRIHPLGVG